MLVRIGLTRDTHFALPRSQAAAADNPLQSARALRMPPGRLGLPAGSVLRRWLADFRVRLLGEEDVGDVCPWIRRNRLERLHQLLDRVFPPQSQRCACA